MSARLEHMGRRPIVEVDGEEVRVVLEVLREWLRRNEGSLKRLEGLPGTEAVKLEMLSERIERVSTVLARWEEAEQDVWEGGLAVPHEDGLLG